MIIKVYTVEEVAEILKVTSGTIREWLKSGKLKGYKLGGRYWRIKEEDLVSFINEK